MAAPSNPNRRSDIAAALKKARKNDMLTLASLAVVWGVHKSRFVSVAQVIPNMPDPVPQGAVHHYPAQAALRAMLAYETRNDNAVKAREQRTAAILGGTKTDRAAAAAQPLIPPRDLATLARLAAEVEERERAQRLFIPSNEVERIAGEVFSLISEFVAEFSNAIDPNGLLDPALRAIVQKNADDALLRFHATMKPILVPHAVAGANRTKAGRSSQPRARRARG